MLAHGRALLVSSPEGRSVYIDADMREPGKILSHPLTQDTLDFTRPVALMLVSVLHFFTEDDQVRRIAGPLVDALPPGSYLAASHITPEHSPQGTGAAQRSMRSSGIPVQPRESGVFARLAFSGLDLVPPGVVLVSEWRPDSGGPRPTPAEVGVYGGVARKP